MAKLNKSEIDKAHKELKAEARERVAERGILQFRADAETIKAVLKAADDLNVPVGALLRQWVREKVSIESAKEQSPDLVQRVVMLEEAVSDLLRKLP